MRFISSSVSVKSNTFKLSVMRWGFEENGMAATFCCTSQRSAICAMLRPVVYGDVFKSANVLESKVAGDVTGCP
jgi:hypothetical protein